MTFTNSFFLILPLFLLLLNYGYSQSYDNDMPYVDPTGTYQLFNLLKYEVPQLPNVLLMLGEIERYLEVQYKYGANGDKRGIDCSALMLNIFKNALKKQLPRTAASQYSLGRSVLKTKDLQFGDLVFFRINSKKISHVGMYIASGHFVHASSSVGVTISNLSESYYQKFYIGAKRLFESMD